MKRTLLVTKCTLWKDFGNSSYVLGAPDVRAGDDFGVLITCTTLEVGGADTRSCLQAQ